MNPILSFFLGACTVLGGLSAAFFFGNRWFQYFGHEARTRRKARRIGLDTGLVNEEIEIVSLLVKQPYGWQVSLLERCMRREVDAHRELRVQLDYNLPSPRIQSVSFDQSRDYLRKRSDDLVSLIEETTSLFEIDLRRVMNPDGSEFDPQSVLQLSRKIGALYRSALEWTRDMREHVSNQELRLVVEQFSNGGRELGRSIEEILDLTWFELERALNLPSSPRVTTTIKIRTSLNREFVDAALEEIRSIDSGG